MITRLLGFLMALIMLFAGCVKPSQSGESEPAASEDAEVTEEPYMEGNVVFFGDSITYMGRWERYFEGVDAINLGVSGDKVSDLQDRIGEVYAAEPAKLFIMAGVNDLLSGYTVDETIAEWSRLLDLCPACRIYAQSVLPVDAGFGSEARVIPEFNERLKALCSERGIEYVDLFPLYDDGSGFLAARHTVDGLHLNRDAYYLWADAIRDKVE